MLQNGMASMACHVCNSDFPRHKRGLRRTALSALRLPSFVWSNLGVEPVEFPSHTYICSACVCLVRSYGKTAADLEVKRKEFQTVLATSQSAEQKHSVMDSELKMDRNELNETFTHMQKDMQDLIQKLQSKAKRAQVVQNENSPSADEEDMVKRLLVVQNLFDTLSQELKEIAVENTHLRALVLQMMGVQEQQKTGNPGTLGSTRLAKQSGEELQPGEHSETEVLSGDHDQTKSEFLEGEDYTVVEIDSAAQVIESVSAAEIGHAVGNAGVHSGESLLRKDLHRVMQENTTVRVVAEAGDVDYLEYHQEGSAAPGADGGGEDDNGVVLQRQTTGGAEEGAEDAREVDVNLEECDQSVLLLANGSMEDVLQKAEVLQILQQGGIVQVMQEDGAMQLLQTAAMETVIQPDGVEEIIINIKKEEQQSSTADLAADLAMAVHLGGDDGVGGSSGSEEDSKHQRLDVSNIDPEEQSTNRIHERDQARYMDEMAQSVKEQKEMIVRKRSLPHGCRNWPCFICGKEFTFLRYLKCHTFVHKERTLCCVCGKMFGFVPETLQHQSLHFDLSHQCHVCGQGFDDLHELGVHLTAHEERVAYRCDQCGEEAATPLAFIEHMKSHQDISNDATVKNKLRKPCIDNLQGKVKFSGSEIGAASLANSEPEIRRSSRKHKPKSFDFEDSKDVKKKVLMAKQLPTKSETKHVRSKEDRDEPNTVRKSRLKSTSSSLVCSFCSKICRHKSALQIHERTHTGEKPFLCTKCGKSYSRQEALREHESVHTDQYPFSCVVCGKAFRWRKNLWLHTRSHASANSLHCCQICGKTFKQGFSYNRHMEAHAGAKPFKCPTCDKAFMTSQGLEQHIRQHTGSKPFRCHLCGETFRYYNARKVHVMGHTGEKPFKCNICGTGFTGKYAHKVHMRNHTGERPVYSCTLCEKTFLNQHSLKAHAVVHTGERPFKCDLCAKTFPYSVGLRKHMIQHDRHKTQQGRAVH